MSRRNPQPLHLILALLLALQLALPFLHLCLDGHCDPHGDHGAPLEKAGLHNAHGGHLHSSDSDPCLTSRTSCRDITLTLDSLTPFQPGQRSHLVPGALPLAGVRTAGLDRVVLPAPDPLVSLPLAHPRTTIARTSVVMRI